MAVTQNFVKQSRADRLAGVYRNNSAPAIFVAQKMVTAADPDYCESGAPKCINQVSPTNARTPAHAAMTIR
jgi:hypothetical protein